jgi:alginate O-acetyltransferase complex protein AlgI
MLFNSFQFLVFFVITWCLLLLLRGTPRKILLLIASYYFYMCWSTKYILVIWGITIVDYLAALMINKSKTPRMRKVCLGISLFCNIGLLVVFKYLNLLGSLTTQVSHFAGLGYEAPIFHLILPVGLSFHTFQAMSYTLDVYEHKAPAERNIIDYALYVAFFPQMVAGPIERPNQLLPQFHRDPTIRFERVRSGLIHTLWGLYKKMVIADALGGFVSFVYGDPRAHVGIDLWIATFAFALQIYCDFSGYSDIALGTARMMGYELRLNFSQPYFSRSIAEFWRRWHISLSTWFRDYVYIPLGGNRVAINLHYRNLAITFLLSGLWHGANLTFVVWGAYHAALLICSQLSANLRSTVSKVLKLDRLPKTKALFQCSFTFSLVTIGWVVFRASNLTSALYILRHLFSFGHFNSMNLPFGGIPRANVPFLACFIAIMFLVDWYIMHPHKAPRLWENSFFRKCCYYACIFSIIFFGVFGHTDFIYFQF